MSSNPSLTVEEAAELLKISKYTLYELIKKGEIPAQRVGRQLRLDREVLEHYLRGSRSNYQALSIASGQRDVRSSGAAPGVRFTGSHDPVVELLLEFGSHAALDLSTSFVGSMEGLIELYKGQADIAGVHLWDDNTETYNLPFVKYLLPGEEVTVVNLVQRVQGWIVPSGNPLGLKSWEDLGRKGVRLVNRQRGSGTRLRLDSYVHKAKLNPSAILGYGLEESTHYGVAYRVAAGEADAGIGVQAAADRLGLEFIPLFNERYDLVSCSPFTGTEEWRHILDILNSAVFQKAVQRLVGYDTSLTGKIMNL
ncbi:substrate-binding domain-containing protein [Paradesulfitobacterium ferrireducens]|uniref:substrate-binding domain-containing protein n=1 Tax=Paradesulfitobacterium ferrireducens TaxID=2816476 RepID=UPI001A8CBE8F|nr:substrate-binding domain-containing protein [Paradesulfitobacterium ferrireducens]